VAEVFPVVALVLRTHISSVWKSFEFAPAPVAGWYNAAHIPVGLASDTITYGSDVVASMYWSIGIDIVSGSRIATARTALHISIANLALAVACIGHEACVRLVVPVSTATNRRIPCITVEKRFVRDCMHCQ